MNKNQTPRPMPQPNKNDVAGTAPASSPTSVAAPAAPDLAQPASLIPGFDPSPAGLADEVLKDLEEKAGMPAQAPLVRPSVVPPNAEDLDAPSHTKPEMENVARENHSNVRTPKASKNGFEVQALQLGFYNQHRYRENDVFLIRSWEDLGDWMKLTDPDFEKQHKEEIKVSKAKK